MPLSPGSRLGPYEVVSPLGAGGMGEVYRARDTRLERDVALKVLPAGLLSDEASRSRFRKEAKALSRLSHPHVATLLDFGSEDGSDYLVMELIPGPTLDTKVQKGPLPSKDVVRLGAQLARGLKAAHDQGVIHRDLKPSNLCLTEDGLLKILDFGLARIARPGAHGDTDTDTAQGKVMGSPPYMPPEQVLGKAVDARADIYSVGAVLYELATGLRPFGERTGAALTDAILHDLPESPRSVNGTLSPGLEAVIVKALDKDPGLRYQTTGELLVDLERLQQGSEAGASDQRGEASGVRGRRSTPRRWRRGMIATAVTLTVVAAATWLLRPASAPRITAVRSLTGNLTFQTPGFFRGQPSWTTDGDRLYYLALNKDRMALYSVPAGGGESVEIPLPFDWEKGIFGYLPKESALLMRGANRPINDDPEGGAPLLVVSVPSGKTRPHANIIASWAQISPDGSKIALLRGWKNLALARLDGSDERALHTLQEPQHRFPVRWSPDGQRLRFTDENPPGAQEGRWIWEVSAEGGPARALWPGEGGDWTPDGHYFVFSQWDERHSRRDISAVPETSWPRRRPLPRRLTVGPLDFANVGASRDGRRLFAFGTTPRLELARFDSKARRFEPMLGHEPALYADPSPDGKWLAWVRYPEATLWKSRPDGSEPMQLTAPPLEAALPKWSPDGRHIVFAGKTSAEEWSVRMVASDGSGLEVVARDATNEHSYMDPCWLPDGSIVFTHAPFSPGRGLSRVDPKSRKITSIPGADGLWASTCSRQGDVLAWHPHPGPSGDNGDNTVMVLRAGRRAWEDYGRVPADLIWGKWTRDGASFCGLVEARSRIECFSFATRRLEPVVEVRDLSSRTFIGAPWVGLDADDMPLVTVDRDTTALYSLDWDAP